MSQHNITLQSPMGSVMVSAGYDPRLDEAFVTIQGEHIGYMSPPGLAADQIADLVREKTKVSLPQQVIDGVQNDIADLRLGATDIGRRIFQYAPNGELETQKRW